MPNNSNNSARSTVINAPLVGSWLHEVHGATPTATYRHSRLHEDAARWPDVAADVVAYFKAAHHDAISRIRRLAGTSLHPAGTSTRLPPPFDRYPFGLPDVTLQGCFGEVFAGMLAQGSGAAGHDDWEVPAHLFHTHLVLFQQLEQQAHSGVPVRSIFGRTGDDCLAFRRDENGQIVSVLFCESKCTQRHDANLLAEAHDKVATSGIVDILQLIEALAARGDDPDAERWVNALRVFYTGLHASPNSMDRCDAVYYVHGQAPVQSTTWLPPDGPHARYTADRHLHAIEVCLADVSARVRSVYDAEVWL